jgi:Zn-dependent protease/predicted transcriptional regulator
MSKRLTLPKLFGINVYIHWTFSLLIAWIIFTNIRAGLDAIQIGWMVLFILSLFVCVTLHELGHALAARRYGIKTKDITLYPIGGVARLERIPSNPKQELVVALAGPLVNVVIMILLIPFIVTANLQSDPESSLIIDHTNFLPMLGIINIWLALFNLIPAFPMDGGRVLRALLSTSLGRVRATEIAAIVGKVLAVGFIFVGFYINPFLIFIGLFIFLGAHSEKEMVKQQSLLGGLTAKDCLMTKFIMLDKYDTIGKAVGVLLDGEAKNFIIIDNEKPYGIVVREQLIKGLKEHGEEGELKDIANTEISAVSINSPLAEVMKKITESELSVVLVLDSDKMVGIIDSENIGELIMINEAKKQLA